jgi:hypothetical protein
VAVAPPYVPLHLWVLERPDHEPGPDLTALFVEAAPESQTGVDYAASTAAGTMPAANWQAFTQSTEIAGGFPRRRGGRGVATGGGRNAKWCVTRVADLLDDTGVLEESEALDKTVDLTPARVLGHFSAWHRERDKESSLRRGNVEPMNPPATFMRSRMGRFLISRQVDAVAEALRRLDWLGDAQDRIAVTPQLEPPAGSWRTAAVPELARLGLLRYRRAGTATAEPLRAGDVLIPVTATGAAEATVVGADRDGDPAGPGVHVVRPNPAQLNSLFLAGFLLSPRALRRAAGNRVDVRQLEAPLLPLADQERYALVFQDMRCIESVAGHLKNGAGALTDSLAAGLTSGDFRPGPGNVTTW